MKPQAYQKPTIYNSDGTKAQIGTYDIRTDPLTNSKADGILDYINNNLEALKAETYTKTEVDNKIGSINKLPSNFQDINGNICVTNDESTGFVGRINDNDGTLGSTGSNINIKSRWGVGFINGLNDSDTYNKVTVGIDVRKGIVHATSFDGNAASATKATNDGNGNNIASTYLPLSGGTLTGVVNGVTPPKGDNSKKLATTEFVNAKAGNYLPLSGGTVTGSIRYVANGKVFAIENTSSGKNVNLCWNWNDRAGAGIALRSVDYESPGEFILYARDSANSYSLVGKPDGTLTWNNQPLLPVGIVQAFAGTTIPRGWLLCDGSAVSRTDYAALYAVIGTTYGAGDGSTTFNLPNLVDKFVEGSATAGTVKSAGLPNITGVIHPFEIIGWAQDVPVKNQAGALTNRGHTDNRNTASQSGTDNNGGSGFDIGIAFDASLSDPIYGKSTTVQPPALTMRYIIKY